MKDIILATNNVHKVKEMKEILKDLPVNVYSLKEMDIDVDVEETGDTFIENARIKAEAIYDILKHRSKQNFIVIADDSGLMVDYLNGKPGVYSARYAGEHGNTEKNNEKLIDELKGVPYEKRTAKFVSGIALISENSEVIEVLGEARGYIVEEHKGTEGFGYDPLFYVPEKNKTFAEMTGEEKNSLSHRGKALKALRKEMESFLNF